MSAKVRQYLALFDSGFLHVVFAIGDSEKDTEHYAYLNALPVGHGHDVVAMWELRPIAPDHSVSVRQVFPVSREDFTTVHSR